MHQNQIWDLQKHSKSSNFAFFLLKNLFFSWYLSMRAGNLKSKSPRSSWNIATAKQRSDCNDCIEIKTNLLFDISNKSLLQNKIHNFIIL